MKINLMIIFTLFISDKSHSQQIIIQSTPSEIIDTQAQQTHPQALQVNTHIQDYIGLNSEEFYRTATDFLPSIFKIGQHDSKKMAEYLNQATRDPASFANSLPSDLNQKITVITQKVKPLPEERKP